MLMVTHRGPLTSDLHQYHGVRLARIRQSGYSVREIADFAAGLPPDSAVARALDPDWALTSETFLLREIEHGTRVLAWLKTKDATLRQPQHYPEPLPLTRAEIAAQKRSEHTYDPMTIDEANEFLGWT